MRHFVSSLSNSRVRDAAALNRNRARKRSGLVMFDGVREAARAIEAGVGVVDIFICPALMSEMEKRESVVFDTLGFLSEEISIIETTPEVMARIAYRDNPAGVVIVVRRPALDIDAFMSGVAVMADRDPLLLIIEGAEKPGNVGAVFRTADCAGVSGVILADNVCDPFSPNLIRSSLGCVFSVPLLECSTVSALGLLSREGYRVVSAVVDGSTSMWDADLTGRLAIAVGSEKDGLSPSWRNPPVEGIRIPMTGAADSLNLAMATGLLVYEAFRQREFARNG